MTQGEARKHRGYPSWSCGEKSGTTTYVPGFWSWKGLSSTFFTLMVVLCVLQAIVDAIEAIGGFQSVVERLRSTFELSRGAGAPSPPRGMTLSVRRMASTSTHAAGVAPHLRCHLNHFPQHWTKPIGKWRFCNYLRTWSCQNADLVPD